MRINKFDKAKEFLSSIIYNDKPRNIDKNKIKENYFVGADKIEYLWSTHIVLKISIDGETYFFRECEEHLPIKKYVNKFIDFYFSFVNKEKNFSDTDKKRVVMSLEKQENFQKFVDMPKKYICRHFYPGEILDVSSPSIIGLDDYQDIDYAIRIKRFMRYAHCKLYAYYNNTYSFNKNRIHLRGASKIIGYEKTANLLGLNGFIPKSKYVHLTIDNKEKLFGTLMDNAEGISMLSVPKDKRRERIHPKLQRDLINLNLLDFLCGMSDHTIYNYNVVPNEMGKFYKLSVYDNDEESSFETNKCLRGGRNTSLLVENGFINRPYLDKETVGKLFDLKRRDLRKTLCKTFNKAQIVCLWWKIKTLKMAIRSTMAIEGNILLEDNEWSDDTMKKEISGGYGRTYLVSIWK